jgi:hypothetical protein
MFNKKVEAKKINLDSTRLDVENLHPRTMSTNLFDLVDGKLSEIPICSKTGCFSCSTEDMGTEFDQLGLGVVIYFKVIKSFAICFFFMSLICAPLYYFYLYSNIDTPIIDYKDAMFRTSIGAISSSKIEI